MVETYLNLPQQRSADNARHHLPLARDIPMLSDACFHSTFVRTVRRSRPGANGGFTIVIRNVLPSIWTEYVKGSPDISFGFL